MPQPSPDLQKITGVARDTLTLNRMAVRGSSRALVRQVRRAPRHGAWSLPFASIVEMMALGTPSFDIQSAEQIRVPLERITLLAATLPVQRSPVTWALSTASGWPCPTPAPSGCCSTSTAAATSPGRRAATGR